MISKILLIGIIILIVSILIYWVKNRKIFLDFFEKKNNKKIFYIFLALPICLIFMFLYGETKETVDNIKIYNNTKENNKLHEESDRKKEKENEYYNNIINNEYDIQKYKNPYIPNGFSYVEGNYNDGFVIEDLNKNQYVWIPCSNEENKDSIKLQKKNFVSIAFISKDYCYDEEYEEFLSSALENGGFYVSRFEIGIEDEKPVSKKAVNVWNNISKSEANSIIENMYKGEEFKCKLINGFAYDTVLEWIKKNNDIEITSVNVEENVLSGRSEYNRIFDFTDNVLELTSEVFYNNVIVRGFSSSDEEMENGIKFSEESRYTIFKDDKNVSLQDLLGFRTIIYK